MPKLPFYTGNFYAIEDPGAASRQLINLYPEVDESGEGKSPVRLIGTPGLVKFTTIAGDGPVRCLWMGEGRLFAVIGSHIYECFADGVLSDYGSVGDDATHTPAQIFSNGNDLLVISAGYAWRTYTSGGGVVTEHIQLIAAEYDDLVIGAVAFVFDLEIDGADDTKVTSATRPFIADDVGKSLLVRSGTGFSTGTLTISGVSGGWATMSGSVGTVGSTGGEAIVLDSSADDTVGSSTVPFESSDVGSTLVFPTPNATGFTPGTYTIDSVADGIATLDGTVGTVGSVNGVATEHPGESAATDANGNLKAQSGAYLDGYGIISLPIAPRTLTNYFYISENGSFAKWFALDKGTKEGYPDNIQAVFADHQELYLFGDLQSAEVWQDTGAANFPFERNMGAFMTFGLAAQHSLCQLGQNGLAWLGWSAGRGGIQAYYAQGFQPRRISTSYLEHLWADMPDVRDATAYSYHEDGHHFWVINFPSADITWVYDLTASEQMGRPIWHARGRWDGTTWKRSRANCHAYGWFLDNSAHPGATWTKKLTHFVGDAEEGTIWVQGLYNYGEDGGPIRRELQTSHIGNDNLRSHIDLVQIECRAGGGAGEDITWTLDYSRDRGDTFVNPRNRTARGDGKKNQRLRWLRLGESYDWVLRLVTDSQAKVSLSACWFDPGEAD